MEGRPEFELAIVEPEEADSTFEESQPRAPAELSTAPAEPLEALEAIKAARGASAVLAGLPQLGNAATWLQTAYFSVRERTGTARHLIVAGEPGGEVTANGQLLFGQIAPSKSSRVICAFDAPQQAPYHFSARLMNWAPPVPAMVECLIDGTSLGRVTLSMVPENVPFVARLRAGQHSFQVREVPEHDGHPHDGPRPFLFLSLTVWMIPVVTEE